MSVLAGQSRQSVPERCLEKEQRVRSSRKCAEREREREREREKSPSGEPVLPLGHAVRDGNTQSTDITVLPRILAHGLILEI